MNIPYHTSSLGDHKTKRIVVSLFARGQRWALAMLMGNLNSFVCYVNVEPLLTPASSSSWCCYYREVTWVPNGSFNYTHWRLVHPSSKCVHLHHPLDATVLEYVLNNNTTLNVCVERKPRKSDWLLYRLVKRNCMLWWLTTANEYAS